MSISFIYEETGGHLFQSKKAPLFKVELRVRVINNPFIKLQFDLINNQLKCIV